MRLKVLYMVIYQYLLHYHHQYYLDYLHYTPHFLEGQIHLEEKKLKSKQVLKAQMLIVVDDDVNTRDWKDVIWAMTTRMDPKRDMTFVENTPIDYLDFASPVPRLGSKVGMDATNKWEGETTREWGEPIVMNQETIDRVDEIWEQLGIREGDVKP